MSSALLSRGGETATLSTMARLDPSVYLGHLRADGGALVDAARLGLGAQVPSCPNWRVGDLVAHVGRMHQWVTEIVSTRAAARVDATALPPPPGPGQLLVWFATGVERLAFTLAEAGPDARVWNWAGAEPTAAFWFRRMAHETAMHRWDAQSAHGRATPIDPLLASDGIDELLEVFLPLAAPGADLGGSLHLHASDTAGEWLVCPGEQGPKVQRSHAAADAVARGPACTLLLCLWRRVAPAALDTDGDAAILARWQDLIRID